MSLGTYTDLQTSIGAWLNRTDLAAIIPDFIALAESRMARDLRLMNQIQTVQLLTIPGVQSIEHPYGWLEYENLSVVDSGGITRQLTYVNVEHLDIKYPDPAYTALPVVYSIEGGNVLFGPTPDAAYIISAIYYKRFDPLSKTPTNWLLTNYPSMYLHLSLMNGAMYLKDKQAATDWENLYMEAMTSLQGKDDTAAHSGSSLRVRTI